MTTETKEIRNILTKGQLKSGFNPLAALDGLLSGDIAGAIIDSTDLSITSAMYAKCAKLHTKTQIVSMNCSVKESAQLLKSIGPELKKRLLALTEAPTNNPYIAYYSKGRLFSNPTVVVVESRKTQNASEIVLTAFTTKVGFIRGHSCNVAMKKFLKLM